MTMDTKALLAEAEALKPQLLTDRRTLHRDQIGRASCRERV